MSQRSIRHRLSLRPRAGLAATALLLAGLAGASAVTVLDGGFIEPATAETAAAGKGTMRDAAHRPSPDAPAAKTHPGADPATTNSVASDPTNPRDQAPKR